MIYIINDIKNWLTVRRVVRANRDTIPWNELRLRHDWIYRIGTVINMKPEDFGDDKVTHIDFGGEHIPNDVVRAQRFLKDAKPIFDYLKGLDISDLIHAEKTLIPNSTSYILKFQYIFQKLSLPYAVKAFMIFGLLFTIGYIYFDDIMTINIIDKIKHILKL